MAMGICRIGNFDVFILVPKLMRVHYSVGKQTADKTSKLKLKIIQNVKIEYY